MFDGTPDNFTFVASPTPLIPGGGSITAGFNDVFP